MGFPDGASVNRAANAGDISDVGLFPGLEDPLEESMANPLHLCAWRIPWAKRGPGECHSPQDHKESDTTEVT